MKQKTSRKIAKYIILLFITMLFFFPIYWMVSMAFKPYPEWTSATGTVYWTPGNPTLDNFKQLFQKDLKMSSSASSAVGPIINSLILAISGTVLAMVLGVFAAYGISRYKAAPGFPFQLLQLRMFPPVAVIIPIMIMFSVLHLIDTWFGLTLLYGVVTLPFAVWLMMTFFDDIPDEITEAAIVDGCSNFGAFFKTVLPLAKGGIASTALFVFILNWSDFGIALFITGRDWSTIPIHLAKLQTASAGHLYGPKSFIIISRLRTG